MQLTISSERISRLRVWILVPAHGDQIHATFSSCLYALMGTLRMHGIEYNYVPLPGDSLITRARNNLADIFYSQSYSDNDHYSLWLDSDILFEPESVLQMLALDLDFVAAPYSTKGLHLDRMAAAAQLGWPAEKLPLVAGNPNLNGLTADVLLDRPMPLRDAGSGFWLVKRKVFRIMAESLPIRYRRCPEERSYYGRDYAHDFFKVGIWPGTDEYLSEDWWFSRQWRELGGTVYGALWIPTSHLGLYRFQLSMVDIQKLLVSTGGAIKGPTWRNHARKAAADRGGTEESAGENGRALEAQEDGRADPGESPGPGGSQSPRPGTGTSRTPSHPTSA